MKTKLTLTITSPQETVEVTEMDIVDNLAKLVYYLTTP